MVPTSFTNNMSKTDKQIIGAKGESIACKYLLKKGFGIVERNHLRKWGEIDIVAQKNKVLRFVEVKTVSCENIGMNVIHETFDQYRPEDNVHPFKLQRMARVIQTYLADNAYDGEWQFDVLTVHLDTANKIARVNMLENVIL